MKDYKPDFRNFTCKWTNVCSFTFFLHISICSDSYSAKCMQTIW